jgi:hypothetical protein
MLILLISESKSLNRPKNKTLREIKNKDMFKISNIKPGMILSIVVTISVFLSAKKD